MLIEEGIFEGWSPLKAVGMFVIVVIVVGIKIIFVSEVFAEGKVVVHIFDATEGV